MGHAVVEVEPNSHVNAHISVLKDKCLHWWFTKAVGVYVDCTFGRGGHTRALLQSIQPGSQLIVIDKDPSAIRVANELAQQHQDITWTIIQGSFAELGNILKQAELFERVDGIFYDLGVSSPQLDEANRGFSFMRDGPLDMRMDTTKGDTAAQWLSSVDEQTLANALYQFGEEKRSRRIAKQIVAQREQNPFETTLQLAQLVEQISPRRTAGKHPATRTFQAIRIVINRELEDLQAGLEAGYAGLGPKGRLIALTFHSLEDRIVKQFMHGKAVGFVPSRRLPLRAVETAPSAKVLVKGVGPSEQEITENPRARSVRLRVLEKV